MKNPEKMFKICNKQVGAVLAPKNPKGCLGESTKDQKPLTFYFEFCLFQQVLRNCPDLDPSFICSKDFSIYG